MALVTGGSSSVDIRYGVLTQRVAHEGASQHHAPPRKRITHLRAHRVQGFQPRRARPARRARGRVPAPRPAQLADHPSACTQSPGFAGSAFSPSASRTRAHPSTMPRSVYRITRLRAHRVQGLQVRRCSPSASRTRARPSTMRRPGRGSPPCAHIRQSFDVLRAHRLGFHRGPGSLGVFAWGSQRRQPARALHSSSLCGRCNRRALHLWHQRKTGRLQALHSSEQARTCRRRPRRPAGGRTRQGCRRCTPRQRPLM